MIYKLKKNQIYASEIAEFLNLPHCGEDFIVDEPRSLSNLKPHCVSFLFDIKYFAGMDKTVHPILLIAPPEIYSGIEDESDDILVGKYLYEPSAMIFSKNPKVDFIKVMNEFFTEEYPHKIHVTSVIECQPENLGSNLNIGPHSCIGPNVKIGKNTYIGANVSIAGDVIIGKDCVIKDGAVIGSESFSFWYDENRVPIHFPQIGRIIIGNSVWIGANSTVERQALGETVIHDQVKIDDLVQIGHGSIIGEGSQIAAHCVIFGSAKIGKQAWIAPGALIRESVKVGERALVGMGSVVIKDVPDHVIVAGNPAHELKQRNFKEGMYGWTD